MAKRAVRGGIRAGFALLLALLMSLGTLQVGKAADSSFVASNTANTTNSPGNGAPVQQGVKQSNNKVGIDYEKKMLEDFAKLPQQDRIAPILVKYSSLPENDKTTVTKYYNENLDKLPKCTLQLINLFFSIQDNYKFILKFNSLIKDGKFVDDESIVDEVKSLPQGLKGIYSNLLKLDPSINLLFSDDFPEIMTTIDNNAMKIAVIIDDLKKQRLAKDEEELAKEKEELAKEKEVLKALKESNILFKKFIKDFNAIEELGKK